MTEESDETVERLVCQYGHMAKEDNDLQEGDKCPHHDCPEENTLEKVKISKHKLKLKDKLHSHRRLGGRESDIKDCLEHTPSKAGHWADSILDRYDKVLNLGHEDREGWIESLEALHELGFGNEKTKKLIENPWSVCFECGKVCKNSKGRKIHETKEHRNNVFL